uniref:Uncharacterized protein n=1 Tax=Pyxicephalus adspersus TaxID=30357 RepID=A0AAV3B207_PYXAD|nr:TPA: hypothetical protein GDO54_008971 [Pyxicephalus adspersus]
MQIKHKYLEIMFYGSMQCGGKHSWELWLRICCTRALSLPQNYRIIFIVLPQVQNTVEHPLKLNLCKTVSIGKQCFTLKMATKCSKVKLHGKTKVIGK